MNAQRKLDELEAELREAGAVVKLTLTPAGVKVTASTVGDRLVAISVLKKRGVIVAP